MRKWTMTAGILFCAAASVYSNQAIGAKEPGAAKPADQGLPPGVQVLDTTASMDPFAPSDPADPADPAQPATQPEYVTEVMPGRGAPAAPLMMNSDGTFSLNIVNGADLVEQLRVIGFQAQMSIIPSKEVRGGLPAVDLYNVTVTEALDALLHSNGYAWRQKGNFIHVYSAKELEQMEKAQRVMSTQVIRLYYTPAANAVNMIKPVLSSDGQVSFTTPAVSGIESGAKDVGGNSHANDDMLVITDYPENLDRVRAILREVDQRPQQVLIEATILRAALTEDNQLGVDFNVLSGINFASGTGTGSGQINNASFDGADLTGNQQSSVGTGTSFTSPIGSGLKFGLITQNVSVFVAALEGVTDTVILANPKILALNKQKGEVIVGRKDGYLTTTLTDTTATQTVEFLDTGTRLIFRPFIGDDGYIRMEIHPEDSSGGVNAQGLPSKVTTEVTSNVMIKDGHTIVIGGLFRESSEIARSQVPILGNIPLAGHLFRNQRDRTTREEVIILLTPHIVKDQSVYAQLSESQLRDAERMRVGVRRGMMFWGRERMADLYYNCALSELSKPNPDRRKAIFFLDASNSLNPKFIDAVNLRQDLTGRELTTADGSSVRSFVSNAILLDQPPMTPPAEEEEDDDVRVETVPTTQPYAQLPATQPAESPLPEQPLSELTMELPFEFVGPNGGFQPTPTPVEGLSLLDPCDDCEFETRPLAETDMESPSYLPVVELTVPSTQPVASDDSTAPTTQPVATGATTQPVATGSTTQPSMGFFGLHGLGAVMNEMLKNSGNEEDAAQNDTTVTELPMEELPGGDNK